MECFRNTNIFSEQEEALKLLICLVQIVPAISREYVPTIVAVLVPQIQEGARLLFGQLAPSASFQHSEMHLEAFNHGRQAEVGSVLLFT